MGVNASILGLTHYEDLPAEVLQIIVAELRKPADDGTSWPVLSKVCKDWRRAAGEVVKTLRMDCQGREWDSLQLYLQYPKLQKLSVFGRVSYRFLAQFEELPDLRELRLEPDSYRKLLVKESESMLFAKLTQLTRLEVCRPAPWAARYLRGRDALSFSCLTQLRQLCIEDPPATVFLHLAGISTLTMLECGHWEDEIVTLTQLRELKITNCQEDAFEGSAVSNLSKLRSLRLGVVDVDGVYVRQRVEFSRLQKLPALTELYLTYAETYLRHLTVSQLKDLDQLKTLSISNPHTGRLTHRLMLDLVLMKHLVCLEVAVKGIETSLNHYASALLDLQEMPFLECMSWTCSEGTFPAALHSVARTMRKDRKNKLKGYMIEDSSGIYMATVME